MLDKSAIRGGVSSEFGSDWKSQVISELTNRGFTPAEITAVEPFLDDITNEITSATDMGLDDFEVAATEEITSELTNAVSEKKAIEQRKKSEGAAKSYEVFNAKKTLKRAEPIFADTKFTSPVNIQDADYTLSEDYPNSYGMIDEKKNWIKVNKVTGHVEVVHNSGTLIKIDGDGNVTMHIVGSFKRIVEGDFSDEIRGNYDLSVKGSRYKHIGKDEETIIGGNLKRNTSSNETITVGGSVTETYGGSHTSTVAGAYTKTTANETHSTGAYTLNSSSCTVTSASVMVGGANIMVQSSGLLLLQGAPLALVG